VFVVKIYVLFQSFNTVSISDKILPDPGALTKSHIMKQWA